MLPIHHPVRNDVRIDAAEGMRGGVGVREEGGGRMCACWRDAVVQKQWG